MRLFKWLRSKLLGCQFRKECGYYQDNVTCNSEIEASMHCGKYRNFSEVK